MGICFYAVRWKKPVHLFIIIILILSIAGPMRAVFDQTQFQVPEEEQTCLFLATNLHPDIDAPHPLCGYTHYHLLQRLVLSWVLAHPRHQALWQPVLGNLLL